MKRLSSFLVLALLAVTSRADAYYSFGSIAYSLSTARWGTSWSQPDRYSADSIALNRCAAFDCQVQVWVRSQCGALAVDRTGFGTPIHGWGTAAFRAYAEQRALGECQARSPYGGCNVVAWVCSN